MVREQSLDNLINSLESESSRDKSLSQMPIEAICVSFLKIEDEIKKTRFLNELKKRIDGAKSEKVKKIILGKIPKEILILLEN